MRITIRPNRTRGNTLAAALTLLLACACSQAQSSRPSSNAAAGFNKYAYIAYFTPADRDPQPGYRERLDRILTDVQDFYRREMQRNGFGPMTFPLERDADGRLIIHVVRSPRPYGTGADAPSADIRELVRQALLKAGIDIDHEHVILFQNLLAIKGDEIRSFVNYTYGGLGDHTRGTAWVTDHPLEDSLNLDKLEPVLDCHGRRQPLCDYVVSEMGGIAHEFGHALGLPHDCETPAQRETLGIALMGNGNFAYARERTPKGGKGAFLSTSEATVLSSHPLFKRDTVDLDTPLKCEFEDVSCVKRGEALVFSGRVRSNIRPYAIVAYHDSQLIRADYEATSWVAEVDRAGRFEVGIAELKPGPYELRLRCCCASGANHVIQFQYQLDDSLTLSPASIRRQFLYRRYIEPGREARDAAQVAAGVEKLKDDDDLWYRKAQQVHRLLGRRAAPPTDLTSLGDEVHSVPLSAIRWEFAEVWGAQPARDGTPDAQPLESAERVHERGLYAHAKSSYSYRLAGKWKQLDTAYALQNWVPGSVVFVIRCDGVEQLRTPVLRTWNEGRANIDLTGVDRLELVVEAGEDDEWDDDANWLSPTLSR